MHISLHEKARTTPTVRAEIATSQEAVAALVRRFSVTENEPQAKFRRSQNTAQMA